MTSNWQFEKIPVLHDNFVYVLYRSGKALVVDPGESEPVLEFLSKQDLSCEMILITHHHDDHIAGISKIVGKYDCPVLVPEKNFAQIPGATHKLQEGMKLELEDLSIEVWEVPGHTLGHLAYWVPQQEWLFSGDVLFNLGCGRLFEGSFDQMFATLSRVKGLPDQTLVFCTHDYFAVNERFCRQLGFPTAGYVPGVPLQLKQEKLTNPFLAAASVDAFRDLRQKRNLF